MIDFSSLKDLPDSERLVAIEQLRQQLHELSPVKSQPVDRIRWVPVEMVEPLSLIHI